MNSQTLYLGSWGQLEGALSRRVIALRAQDPLQPLTVVCGSAAAAGHLRRAVTRESGGLVLVDFTTIHRLASAVAAGPLQMEGKTLADEAEILRLISTVLAGSGETSYFSRIRGMPGLPRALRRAFKDLREARVTPAQLAVLEGEAPRELALLYGRYLRALGAAGRGDDSDLYEAAAGVLAADPSELASAWVGLYGLYDLPGTQRHFIEALARGRRLDAFVPGPPQAPYAWPARDLFAGLGCEPSSCGEEPAAGRAPGPAAVEVVSVEDSAAERQEMLRRVVAVAEQGGRFHEIAVVHPDAGVAGAVRGEPGGSRHSCGGPCPAPHGGHAPALGAPLGRCAGVGTTAGSSGGDRPCLGLRAARQARAEPGVALGPRLPGREGRCRRRPVARQTRGARRAVRASPPRPRATLLGFVDEVEVLRAAAHEQGTWPSFAEWLAGALETMGVPADDPMLSAVRRLARLADIEAGVSLDGFAAVARDVVADQTEGLGSLGRTGVAVVSPEQVRGLRFPLVFFGGLVEGLFPARPSPDPLLDDDMRAQLSARSGARLSTVALRSAESDLLFALTTDAAERSLVLVRARSRDGSGAPQLPSRHLVAICRELAGKRLTFAAVDTAGEVGGRVTRIAASPVPHPGWPGEVPGVDEREVDAAALMRSACARRTAAGGRLSCRRARR